MAGICEGLEWRTFLLPHATPSCPWHTNRPHASHRPASKPSSLDLAHARQRHAVDTIEWQSPLQIIKYPDPRLRAVNARIGAVDPQLLLKLAGEMFELMYQ